MGSTRCWTTGASDPPGSFTPSLPLFFLKKNFPHITRFCFEGDNREHFCPSVPLQPHSDTEDTLVQRLFYVFQSSHHPANVALSP